METIRCLPSSTVEASTFVFGRGKTALSYEHALAKILPSSSLPEATSRLLFIFDSAVEAKENSPARKFWIPKLSDATKKLFYRFRWYSNDDGTTAMYVRASSCKEVYILTQDPYATATAVLTGGPDNETLEDVMAMEYELLAMAGELSFLPTTLGVDLDELSEKDLQLPSFAEYWDTIIKYWKRDSFFRLLTSPVEITDDEKIPAFFYFNYNDLTDGPTDAWDDWMEIFPAYARPVFRAWFASVFDPKNKGRQCFWLQDQGYTGKSSMIRAVTRFMGQRSVAAISKDSMSNQFGYATIYGRRLVVYGDNKNPKLLHDSKVHSILGGDVVSIERKNVQAFSAAVHAKMLIGANVLPEVDLSAKSEISRVLIACLTQPSDRMMKRYCKIDPITKEILRQADGTPIFIGGNLEDRLYSQIEAFLLKCLPDYSELCPNRMDIAVPRPMYDAIMTRCPSPEFLSMEKFVFEELSFGADKRCAPHDLAEAYGEYEKTHRSSVFDYSRLKNFLTTRYGAEDYIENGKRWIKGVAIEHQMSSEDLEVPVGLE